MLELRGLTKSYGDVRALDGCSFQAAPGRVLGFLGRNGAGKTTTMRGIFGLISLDAGEVRWQGHPVTARDRLGFGYMPEERGLYPRMRIHDQLVYFGRLRGLSATEATRQSLDWLQRLDLEARASETLDSLSHGNQQRVQLALALIGAPELLVLDEPFAGLDPIAADTLASVIRQEAGRGCAVVFSSHQLDQVAGVCDDIAVITRGRVVLNGDLAALRRASGLRYLDFGLVRPIARDQLDRLVEAIHGRLEEWREDRFARLRLAGDVRSSRLAALLQDLGELEYLRFEPPDLEELFKQAVEE